MKKLSFPRFILLVSLICLASGIAPSRPKSDDYIRNRIVRLKSNEGMCSGEQVRAPSGKDYILSAGHCLGLKDKNDMFHVVLEDGSTMDRKLIAEDPASDLILIEGLPHLHGLDIAKKDHRFQEIRTFSHGHDYDTYTTKGVIVQDARIQITLKMILSREEMNECRSQPKYSINMLYGILPVCVLNVPETVTTAMIVPGSSGGASVDARGDLIGVNSATGDGFGFLVRLADIQMFLSGK